MKALTFLMFLGLIGVPSFAQAPTRSLGLPVGPGRPGIGPFELKVWPWEGCKTCVAPQQDLAVYKVVRDALLSGDFHAISVDNVHVTVLRIVNREIRDSLVALPELRSSVQACKVLSEGMLPAYNDSSPGTSFGLSLGCPEKQNTEFLSITIMNHRTANIYYLPDEPLWVYSSVPVSN